MWNIAIPPTAKRRKTDQFSYKLRKYYFFGRFLPASNFTGISYRRTEGTAPQKASRLLKQHILGKVVSLRGQIFQNFLMQGKGKFLPLQPIPDTTIILNIAPPFEVLCTRLNTV